VRQVMHDVFGCGRCVCCVGHVVLDILGNRRRRNSGETIC